MSIPEMAGVPRLLSCTKSVSLSVEDEGEDFQETPVIVAVSVGHSAADHLDLDARRPLQRLMPRKGVTEDVGGDNLRARNRTRRNCRNTILLSWHWKRHDRAAGRHLEFDLPASCRIRPPTTRQPVASVNMGSTDCNNDIRARKIEN
jgi:hypothetical protein